MIELVIFDMDGVLVDSEPAITYASMEALSEIGVKARPMKPEWVRSILQQSDEQGAAFFFKQWGTWGSDGVKRNKKANGKALDGQIIQMMPELDMRENR